MVEDNELNKFIDKLHLRSFDKIWIHVKNEFNEGGINEKVSKEQLRRVMKKRIKDPVNEIKKNKKKFMNTIFSDHPYSYVMDILENQAGYTPRFWMIFVNVNTRYAHAYDMRSKDKNSVKGAIEKFINHVEDEDEQRVYSLTGDDEGAFSSASLVNYLKDKKVSLRIVKEQNHGALSIIDRFIRTLRDMNIPTEKTKRESGDLKYMNFSVKRMKKLIKIYNNTFHGTIGMTPKEMQNDYELEDKYIRKMLIKSYNKFKQEGYLLNEGDWVRVVLERKKMKKRRYKVSRECYKIIGREGQTFIISARDGSTRLVPRWRLIMIGKRRPENIKWAETIEGIEKGVLKRIVDWGNNEKTKYKVEFEMPDGSVYEDVIPISYVRGKYPQMETKLEKEFIKRMEE